MTPFLSPFDPESDRVAEYDMKLLDIDSEHLGIPDTTYEAVVRMSSAEYSRICRDLGTLGESVRIEVSKEGVNFSAEGEIGAAKLTLKQGSGSATAIDDDDDEDDEKPNKKKRKTSSKEGSGDVVPVSIELQQAVNLTFSHKYLANFAKAAPLSDAVALHMSNEVPLLVEFAFENGHVRFYLAPKLSDVSVDRRAKKMRIGRDIHAGNADPDPIAFRPPFQDDDDDK